jgi:hypothetical protein
MSQEGGSKRCHCKKDCLLFATCKYNKLNKPCNNHCHGGRGKIFSAEIAHLWNARKKMLFRNMKKLSIPLWSNCSSDQVISVSKNRILKTKTENDTETEQVQSRKFVSEWKHVLKECVEKTISMC